jgi:hypothetical protein
VIVLGILPEWVISSQTHVYLPESSLFLRLPPAALRRRKPAATCDPPLLVTAFGRQGITQFEQIQTREGRCLSNISPGR